ncbi:MAG: D-glycero-beta-D-manno-heptose 1-phosphate adenylyltransferase [Planctomycetota bacterium]|nr:MAG: D-glycero-beta-D-manno-heptose 1-phosphate adenylyltransferase [Planctomycetota bacterium]
MTEKETRFQPTDCQENQENSFYFKADPFQGKLKSLEELKQLFSLWKKEGKTIVFTNGCFDLIHVGHIRSLRDAKSKGDILVVAVNSDSSVKQYKGSHLPVVPEMERLEVLSALEMVDYLLLFSQTTVKELLLELQPHIHAKGRDYTEKTVPERDAVLSYGGKIAIVGDPKDHSTTSLIEKIQNLAPDNVKNTNKS